MVPIADGKATLVKRDTESGVGGVKDSVPLGKVDTVRSPGVSKPMTEFFLIAYSIGKAVENARTLEDMYSGSLDAI